MRRREFIALLGGASVAWPIAARAQQAGKLPTIGFLGAATSSAWSQWVAAFVQRLRELGWIEGRTVAIEFRWAEGRPERSAEIAAEFVRLKVDVIVTSGAALLEAKQATSSIPTVFAIANDPVGSGFVANLARPGGNITGLSLQGTELAGKRLALLREVVPDFHRLAILANSNNRGAVLEMSEVETTARTLGLTVVTAEIRRAEDIAPALRVAERPCGRTLHHYRRAPERLPTSDQHLGVGPTTPDDARLSGVRRRGRPDVVWGELSGPVPARRGVCRQDIERHEAG